MVRTESSQVVSAMEDPGSDPRAAQAFPLWRVLALPVFVLLCWGLAIRQLSPDWAFNEQYHYGWTVPLLALYLLRLRLTDAPDVGRVPDTRWLQAGVLLVALALAFLLPLREADPEWRLLGLVITSLAGLASILAFWQVGGLRWVAHFACPILFIFTAVPWPHWLENDVLSWLMRRNAGLAVEALHWAGVNAATQGNLIRLSSMTVGVEEACSGIRSLQGALMATLFVGECFRLSPVRRVFLVLSGVFYAFVTNGVRTFFLALMAELGGPDALERWHDTAGFCLLTVCLAAIAVTGLLLRDKGHKRGLPRSDGQQTMKGIGIRWRHGVSTAAWGSLTGMALILFSAMATEAWFRIQEAAVTKASRWSFVQPTEAPHFEQVEQSSRIQGELRYDFCSAGKWLDAQGRRWVAQFFCVNPGRIAARTGLAHNPRYCLTASGMELVRELPDVPYPIGDLVLSFGAYQFRDQGVDVYVYNVVTEDVLRQNRREPVGVDVTLASRLESLRYGRRNLGVRRLEVAVWGAKDASEARTAFEELLHQQAKMDAVPSAS